MTPCHSERHLTFIWNHSLARGMFRLHVAITGDDVFDEDGESEVAAWVRKGVEDEVARRQMRVSTWNANADKGGWWSSSAGGIIVIVESITGVEAMEEAIHGR